MSAAKKAKSSRARAAIAIHMLKTDQHLGRSFDDCFEMYDGEEVVRWILYRAKTDMQLSWLITERGFSHWLTKYADIPEQNEFPL